MISGAALAMAASPSFAQDAEDPSATEVEAVVITGSRIVRQDFEAISPVTTVDSETIELTGTLTVESLLNELPSVVAGNMRTSNNSGGEEFATVDLRGLGPNRTLVLVNGERVPASSTTGVVDLNTIPTSLISRVEVVTGGASAVYGSDAISGVVNFVLKDNYEGAELSATYGASFDGYAPEFELNGLFGGSFANGRGNLTAYASYYSREEVSQSEFDYSRVSAAQCSNNADLSDPFQCDSAAEAQAAIAAGGGVFYSGGSATPAWGTITNNGANPFNAALLNANPLTAGQFASYDHDCNPATPNIAYTGGSLSFDAEGNLEPLNSAGACAVPDRSAGSSRYNFAPDNYLIIPAERFNITTIGHYDITDSVRLRVQMSYVNSWQQVSLAPTPATGLTVTLTPAMQALISSDHPDLWAALQSRPNPLASFGMTRRTNELGPRIGDSENNALSLLGTLTGDFGADSGWDWSVTTSYGVNNFTSTGSGSANASAFRQGLAGCQNPDGSAITGALPGCVPLDIFGQNTMDADMVSFLTVPTFATTEIEESRIAGFVRGDLFELPAGPIAAVLGVEWRESSADFRVDNEQRSGNIYGFNAIQNQAGSIGVTEIYTEVAIPLLRDLPGANYLGLEAGYRYSDYTTVGGLDTYKIGAEWEPVDFLKFRAVFNSAVRAPNVFELFQNGDQGFPGYADPCATVSSPSAATLAFCSGQAGGFDFTGFNAPNSQVEAFAFGNPDLQPETAETFTAGVVFQPDFWPVGSFRASVDYYDIEIQDTILALGAQFFIDDCYDNLDASNPSCDRVVRDTVTGEIDYVNTTRGNQGVFTTNGYDVQAEWTVNLGDYGMPGRIRLNELYSYVDEIAINGNNFVDTTNASIGGANYQWRSVFSAFYDIADWTLMGRWSYTPGMIDDPFGIHPDQRTPEASYVDVSARWNLTDNLAMTAFVGNLFDEDTPQTMSGAIFGQGNTDTQVYRLLGRTFSFNVRARF